jgi:hypothetical protein
MHTRHVKRNEWNRHNLNLSIKIEQRKRLCMSKTKCIITEIDKNKRVGNGSQ